jgi:transposase-like protein
VREEISVHSRWRHRRLDSLDEANQRTSVRATNAIKRLHNEFKRRTQAFLPNAESAALDLARLSANRHAKGRRLAKSLQKALRTNSSTSSHDPMPSNRR